MAVKKGTTLSYVHTDSLGSTSVTTDSSGALAISETYFPYGTTRTQAGTLPTEKQFTGQRLDSTGLYFYNARYYEPAIGRFISPDKLVPNGSNAQDLNRYGYARNNPLRYTDPTGNICVPCAIAVGIVAAKVVDWGWTAWDVYQAGRTLSNPKSTTVDRQVAELTIALAVGLELIEPDEVSRISVPADDVMRRGVIGAARKVFAGEATLDQVPKWAQSMVRGLVTEYKLLDRMGITKSTRLISAVVDGKLVKTLPDNIDDISRSVLEIKDVGELRLTDQILAQRNWALNQPTPYQYTLMYRQGATLKADGKVLSGVELQNYLRGLGINPNEFVLK